MMRGRAFFRLLPVAIAMGALSYQSNQPGSSFSLPDITHIDKLLHCLAYTVLGLSFLFALPPQWRQHARRVGLATVLFCLLYGLLDEFHQSFIPGRFAGLDDVAADVAGGLLAVTVDWGWRRWRRNTALTRGCNHEPPRSE